MEAINGLVEKLDERYLKSGFANYEGLGQIDGVPVEFTLEGELHNGVLPLARAWESAI